MTAGMNNIVKPKPQAQHPLSGKMKLAGYTSLAFRLGVPRTSAIRMVERGEIRTFGENPNELVVSERDVESVALQVAIKAKADWEKAQDRQRVAKTLADPDKATDNDLVYSLARTTGKEQSELFWHFSSREKAGRPFIREKYHQQVSEIEKARGTFPVEVMRFNAEKGMTEAHLVAPPRLSIPKEE